MSIFNVPNTVLSNTALEVYAHLETSVESLEREYKALSYKSELMKLKFNNMRSEFHKMYPSTVKGMLTYIDEDYADITTKISTFKEKINTNALASNLGTKLEEIQRELKLMAEEFKIAAAQHLSTASNHSEILSTGDAIQENENFSQKKTILFGLEADKALKLEKFNQIKCTLEAMKSKYKEIEQQWDLMKPSLQACRRALPMLEKDYNSINTDITTLKNEIYKIEPESNLISSLEEISRDLNSMVDQFQAVVSSYSESYLDNKQKVETSQKQATTDPVSSTLNEELFETAQRQWHATCDAIQDELDRLKLGFSNELASLQDPQSIKSCCARFENQCAAMSMRISICKDLVTKEEMNSLLELKLKEIEQKLKLLRDKIQKTVASLNNQEVQESENALAKRCQSMPATQANLIVPTFHEAEKKILFKTSQQQWDETCDELNEKYDLMNTKISSLKEQIGSPEADSPLGLKLKRIEQKLQLLLTQICTHMLDNPAKSGAPNNQNIQENKGGIVQKQTTTGPISSILPVQGVPVKTAQNQQIFVKYNAGFNNDLYVCGTGPKMSWDQSEAIPLKNLDANTWCFNISGDSPFEFKILLRKQKREELEWEIGPNHRFTPGKEEEIKPRFY
jgi:hypothetical protein